MHSPISTTTDPGPAPVLPTRRLSEAGQERLLSKLGEPLFLARWDHAVFINYAADAAVLQRQIPFALDLRDGRAFVSVVAFTLSRMRPRLGGHLSEWLLWPIATHEFLNVRTYVQHRGEPGIFFLAEWLPNRISVCLGPRSFGLPYRYGHLAYQHSVSRGLRGSIASEDGRLNYEGQSSGSQFRPCDEGGVTEFLLERYTAFTQRGERRRFFRIWHEPWEQTPAQITVTRDDLLENTGAWWKTAEFIGANYSPGAEVWMGRPHRIT